MSFAITNGIDRGIGTTVPLSPYDPGSTGTGVVGTAPPAGSVLVTTGAATGILMQEDPDSPTIERGTQCTCQHRFTYTTYEDAVNAWAILGMGTILEDSAGNIWRLLTCSIQSEAGGKCKLITVSESVSFDLPPDEFQVNSVDLGIDIIKHPRYFPNLYPTTDEFSTIVGQVKSSIIRAIQAYRDAPFFPSAPNLQGFLIGYIQNLSVSSLTTNNIQMTLPNPNFNPNLPVVQDTNIQDGSGAIFPPPAATTASPSPNDPSIPVSVTAAFVASQPSIQLAMAAAQEIISKLWRMEDSPYAAGVEVKYSFYSFLPPLFNLGSYLEDPDFIVPDYFLKPDRALTELPPRGGISYPVAGDDNVFQYNKNINPQDFSSTGNPSGVTQISWLRKADEVVWERGLCKITYTWVGSAIGYFDPQLYGATNRPSVPSDYQTFV
jgi:hypothetical protein